MTPQRTRRTVLGSIASLTALAGCIGPGGPGAGSDIESDGVDGTTLTIRVADGSAISSVNVIAPDDSLAWQRDLAAGANKITIDIGLTYHPGTYRVVGLDDDTTVAETTIDIAPDIAITQVGVGANHLDEMPDSLGSTKSEEAVIELENIGGGPEAIEKLLILGGVPNPTKDLQEQGEDGAVSGIYDREQEREIDNVQIDSGDQLKLFTSSLPFSFEGDGVQCTEEAKEESFRVVAIGRVSGESSVQGRLDYTAAETYDGCSVSISLE